MAQGSSSTDSLQIAKLLRNCLQTLNQLKAELPLLRKEQGISRSDIKLRENQITELTIRLQRLQRYQYELYAHQRRGADLGLPSFKKLSHQELILTDNMLMERLTLVRQVFHRIKMLNKWVEQALNGQLNGLWGTLKLAKFKKIHRDYTQRESFIDRKITDQKILIGKISANLKSRFRIDVENNLQSLIKIYDHITIISNRVSRLNQRIVKERRLLTNMENWLKRRPGQLNLMSLQSPTLEMLKHADAIAKSNIIDSLEYSKSRLTIARDFADAARTSAQQSPAADHEFAAPQRDHSKREEDGSVVH